MKKQFRLNLYLSIYFIALFSTNIVNAVSYDAHLIPDISLKWNVDVRIGAVEEEESLSDFFYDGFSNNTLKTDWIYPIPQTDYNIPFTTSSNYDFDTEKAEINGTHAKLKQFGGASASNEWNFNNVSAYDYNSSKIVVSDTYAYLNWNSSTNVGVHSNDVSLIYHFNEDSGSTAYDSSGHSRNGILHNMVDNDWVEGKLNNSLDFDGLNDYVECNNSQNFDRYDEFSIDCWIKTSKVGGNQMIASDTDGTSGWQILSANDKLFISIDHDIAGVNRLTRYGTTTITDGVWHYIAITYNGTSTNTGIQIFVDGVEESTGGIDALTGSITNSVDTLIACRQSTSFMYDGIIDEFSIYNSTISDSYIAQRWNSSNGAENAVHLYELSNPTIEPITEITGNIQSWDGFTETSTIVGADTIRYILSCDSGLSWRYWSGSAWVTSDETFAQSNNVSIINTNFGTYPTVSNNLVFKAFLHSENGTSTPYLETIIVYYTETILYSTTCVRITPTFNITLQNGCPTFINLTAQATIPATDDISYTIHYNSNYYFWNNIAWVIADGTYFQSNNISIINSNIASFPTQDDGVLFIRTFLKSGDGSTTPALDNLKLFYKIGNTTHNSSYSLIDYPGWFEFNVEEDENTTASSTNWESPLIYIESINETYTIETCMIIPSVRDSHAGILVYNDTDNWLVWGYFNDSSIPSARLNLKGVIGGVDVNLTSNVAIEDTTSYLMVKYDPDTNNLTCYYKWLSSASYVKGLNYTLTLGNHSSGLFASSWNQSTDYSVRWDYFNQSLITASSRSIKSYEDTENIKYYQKAGKWFANIMVETKIPRTTLSASEFLTLSPNRYVETGKYGLPNVVGSFVYKLQNDTHKIVTSERLLYKPLSTFNASDEQTYLKIKRIKSQNGEENSQVFIHTANSKITVFDYLDSQEHSNWINLWEVLKANGESGSLISNITVKNAEYYGFDIFTIDGDMSAIKDTRHTPIFVDNSTSSLVPHQYSYARGDWFLDESNRAGYFLSVPANIEYEKSDSTLFFYGWDNKADIEADMKSALLVSLNSEGSAYDLNDVANYTISSVRNVVEIPTNMSAQIYNSLVFASDRTKSYRRMVEMVKENSFRGYMVSSNTSALSLSNDNQGTSQYTYLLTNALIGVCADAEGDEVSFSHSVKEILCGTTSTIQNEIATTIIGYEGMFTEEDEGITIPKGVALFVIGFIILAFIGGATIWYFKNRNAYVDYYISD